DPQSKSTCPSRIFLSTRASALLKLRSLLRLRRCPNRAPSSFLVLALRGSAGDGSGGSRALTSSRIHRQLGSVPLAEVVDNIARQSVVGRLPMRCSCIGRCPV